VDRKLERPDHPSTQALNLALSGDAVTAGLFVLLAKAILLNKAGLEFGE